MFPFFSGRLSTLLRCWADKTYVYVIYATKFTIIHSWRAFLFTHSETYHKVLPWEFGAWRKKRLVYENVSYAFHSCRSIPCSTHHSGLSSLYVRSLHQRQLQVLQQKHFFPRSAGTLECVPSQKMILVSLRKDHWNMVLICIHFYIQWNRHLLEAIS